ncbi:hypothetical protein cyc_03474 [Cyclospora cayetanensis]|uniref:Uncharacterized protein n=1 Tax=Cyclospora cayetanensis TaxID=88456 RepID=A0A1D3DB03_9EIME|nr:hypothetical protein cyc_03474 [Cyclospora cayetanensis]
MAVPRAKVALPPKHPPLPSSRQKMAKELLGNAMRESFSKAPFTSPVVDSKKAWGPLRGSADNPEMESSRRVSLGAGLLSSRPLSKSKGTPEHYASVDSSAENARPPGAWPLRTSASTEGSACDSKGPTGVFKRPTDSFAVIDTNIPAGGSIAHQTNLRKSQPEKIGPLKKCSSIKAGGSGKFAEGSKDPTGKAQSLECKDTWDVSAVSQGLGAQRNGLDKGSPPPDNDMDAQADENVSLRPSKSQDFASKEGLLAKFSHSGLSSSHHHPTGRAEALPKGPPTVSGAEDTWDFSEPPRPQQPDESPSPSMSPQGSSQNSHGSLELETRKDKPQNLEPQGESVASPLKSALSLISKSARKETSRMEQHQAESPVIGDPLLDPSLLGVPEGERQFPSRESGRDWGTPFSQVPGTCAADPYASMIRTMFGGPVCPGALGGESASLDWHSCCMCRGANVGVLDPFDPAGWNFHLSLAEQGEGQDYGQIDSDSACESDLEDYDNRWGMTSDDRRWGLVAYENRLRPPPPTVSAQYVPIRNNCLGISGPSYRSVYTRPKKYKMGNTYTRHYQLPTVASLLRARFPEFLRKRPIKIMTEGSGRSIQLDGSLQFEVQLETEGDNGESNTTHITLGGQLQPEDEQHAADKRTEMEERECDERSCRLAQHGLQHSHQCRLHRCASSWPHPASCRSMGAHMGHHPIQYGGAPHGLMLHSSAPFQIPLFGGGGPSSPFSPPGVHVPLHPVSCAHIGPPTATHMGAPRGTPNGGLQSYMTPFHGQTPVSLHGMASGWQPNVQTDNGAPGYLMLPVHRHAGSMGGPLGSSSPYWGSPMGAPSGCGGMPGPQGVFVPGHFASSPPGCPFVWNSPHSGLHRQHMQQMQQHGGPLHQGAPSGATGWWGTVGSRQCMMHSAPPAGLYNAHKQRQECESVDQKDGQGGSQQGGIPDSLTHPHLQEHAEAGEGVHGLPSRHLKGIAAGGSLGGGHWGWIDDEGQRPVPVCGGGYTEPPSEGLLAADAHRVKGVGYMEGPCGMKGVATGNLSVRVSPPVKGFL